MTLATLKKLEAAFQKARRAYNKAEKEYTEGIVGPKRQELVGRFFKYRNCYSCPLGPEDYWWEWSKVISISDDCLNVLSICSDSKGKIHIQYPRIVPSFDGEIPIGYVETSEREFNREYAALLGKITAVA